MRPMQAMWSYMEAVFSGGDIVKQLPQEAKRFQNIDKGYMKVHNNLNFLMSPKRPPFAQSTWGTPVINLGEMECNTLYVHGGHLRVTADCVPSGGDTRRGGHVLRQRAAAHHAAVLAGAAGAVPEVALRVPRDQAC